MKISKLIEKLQNMQRVHGDVEVRKDVQIKGSSTSKCISWVTLELFKEDESDGEWIVILQ